MLKSRKLKGRRAEIRKNRPDLVPIWKDLSDSAAAGSIMVAVLFWLVASTITLMRDQMVQYRPGQYMHRDVVSRVTFESRDLKREAEIRQAAREMAARVYRRVELPFKDLESRLMALPQEVSTTLPEQIVRKYPLDSGVITSLKKIAGAPKDQPGNIEDYKTWVANYIEQLRIARDKGVLVVLPRDQREAELRVNDERRVKVQRTGSAELTRMDASRTLTAPSKEGEALPQNLRAELLSVIDPLANRHFQAPLAASIAGFTADNMRPTHVLDEDMTAAEQEDAARRVSLAPAQRHIIENVTVLAPARSIIAPETWKLLAEEQKAFIRDMKDKRHARWALSHAGMAGIVLLVTGALCGYMFLYQPRIVRNRMRAAAIAALLASMLLVAQLAGLGTGPLLVFGIAPTVLVAMILSIAYERRLAMGVATLHAILVTFALSQSAAFFVVMWLGAMACCFMLDEVRTRSKLIEVGGVAAIVMMLAASATGVMQGDPLAIIGQNALHVGAAGLGVGFVVLGILPFVEKAFKITTSMTLLELADASQPLLRRLQVEAPGTYNHSLQVATLAEAAAESIGANSLLCRVGAYYHDIGKMNKADYFCENQFDGQNRHINLNPNVSMLIIIGHVKDGVEMAREYNLPPSLIPFIQEHHGTTLIEFFYHEACRKAGEEEEVSETQYRYPGPKPESRETVIMMLADAVESATRAMVEPTANRIETLVHDLTLKRLLDGQFDESDITFAEVERVERSLVKTLLSIYHGRLAYPSTRATTHPKPQAGATAVRSAS